MKYAAVVAAENIKTPADLAGKKIGTARGGSSGQMFMELFLKYHKVMVPSLSGYNRRSS